MFIEKLKSPGLSSLAEANRVWRTWARSFIKIILILPNQIRSLYQPPSNLKPRSGDITVQWIIACHVLVIIAALISQNAPNKSGMKEASSIIGRYLDLLG
jgi:hypothetical protein